MSIISLVGSQLSAAALTVVQAGGDMGDGAMRVLMGACILFGLLLFLALLEFVILEFIWIRVWNQRLRNERGSTATISSRAA